MSAISRRNRRRAQQVRRPHAEKLHETAIVTFGNVMVTAELAEAMTEGISPDTLRKMNEAEVLQRAILGILEARAMP
jgi:hypothetical protein